jgi:hypothetical protein
MDALRTANWLIDFGQCSPRTLRIKAWFYVQQASQRESCERNVALVECHQQYDRPLKFFREQLDRAIRMELANKRAFEKTLRQYVMF